MDERRAALVFMMAEGVGARTASRLLRRHGSLAGALRAALERPGEVPVRRRRSLREAVRRRVWEPQLRKASESGARLVTLGAPGYPRLLGQIFAPPPGIFVQGGTRWVGDRPALAIVGSRAATPRGACLARGLAASMGGAGLTIVSGLARGIDTAAHEGALDADATTVAVLGSGLDRVYPVENEDLARRIARRGALISEFPFGVGPRAEHFPMRNRIVAGLSAGVLVVEAGERSGALITAGIALDEGREVFAVPGAPGDPGSRGTNGLIRAGARLVESASDVLEELGPAWGPFGSGADRTGGRGREPLESGACGDSSAPGSIPDAGRAPGGEAKRRAAVQSLLGETPRTADEIAERLGLPVQEILGDLVELELAGWARVWPGDRYARRENRASRAGPEDRSEP